MSSRRTGDGTVKSIAVPIELRRGSTVRRIRCAVTVVHDRSFKRRAISKVDHRSCTNACANGVFSGTALGGPLDGSSTAVIQQSLPDGTLRLIVIPGADGGWSQLRIPLGYSNTVPADVPAVRSASPGTVCSTAVEPSGGTAELRCSLPALVTRPVIDLDYPLGPDRTLSGLLVRRTDNRPGFFRGRQFARTASLTRTEDPLVLSYRISPGLALTGIRIVEPRQGPLFAATTAVANQATCRFENFEGIEDAISCTRPVSAQSSYSGEIELESQAPAGYGAGVRLYGIDGDITFGPIPFTGP
jgi:hypothetical protein